MKFPSDFNQFSIPQDIIETERLKILTDTFASFFTPRIANSFPYFNSPFSFIRPVGVLYIFNRITSRLGGKVDKWKSTGLCAEETNAEN